MKKQERKDLLLKAAKQVFARHGYHSASIDLIIQEADVARGTFYIHFDGKREIFDSILESAMATINDNIQAIQIGADLDSPVEQLKANFRRCFNLLIDDSDLAQILFYHSMGIDEDCLAQLNRFYDSIARMIESALQQGIALSLVAECDTFTVSHAILGAIRHTFARILNTSPSEKDITLVIDELLKLHLYGLYRRSI